MNHSFSLFLLWAERVGAMVFRGSLGRLLGGGQANEK